ncbi:hypothetical protein M514_05848 [Trichuris suis]|uniref:Uncharacterized protein n=1 Tax=Trichuris suis TaxID=68888 RepID=A0A085MVB8_9BILA|nr:hypothetical protein M513_05848 [Trichuris suis]KFD61164.1 hypothetical protein M514_05848 [Trichuris suis]
MEKMVSESAIARYARVVPSLMETSALKDCQKSSFSLWKIKKAMYTRHNGNMNRDLGVRVSEVRCQCRKPEDVTVRATGGRRASRQYIEHLSRVLDGLDDPPRNRTSERVRPAEQYYDLRVELYQFEMGSRLFSPRLLGHNRKFMTT